MSPSESSRPNQLKYRARNVATTNSAARIRIGPEPGVRLRTSTALIPGWFPFSPMRINLIEHEVNDHARDRNIQPQRKRDAGDAQVTQEVAAKRVSECKVIG